MIARPSSALRRVSAACHKAVGWVDFRLGRLESARRHLERVLHLVGDDFAAYLLLGRVAYRLGDYAGWRRECGHAQRTSPQRYARLRHAMDLVPPRAASAATGPGDAWRSPTFRVSRVGTSGLEAQVTEDDVAQETAPDSCSHRRIRRFGDDFASECERSRFRELPPINSADLARVDLDDLLRDLSR